jgi:hypothetical protein
MARSRFARLTYRHPKASGRAVPPLVRLLGRLERLKLRNAWHSLTDLVMGHAYVTGVAEAAGSLEELHALVSPAGAQDVEPLPVSVWLGERGSLESHDGVAPLELVLGYAGRPISSFVATEPGQQWEWSSVTKRATELGLEPVRRALTEPPERFPGWTTLMGDLAGEPRLTSSA